MRRWLAFSLLSLGLGCREVATDWGLSCKALIEKVSDECKKHGTKGLWPQVCPKYMEGIETMKISLPPEGTFKEKIDEADLKCTETLNTYNDLTKNVADFPRN
jgi:hypothetical protein